MQHERNRQSVTVNKLQILERLKSQGVDRSVWPFFYSAFRPYFPCVTLGIFRVFRCPDMGGAIVK